jgi:beta-N-acetylhexosaminidase
MPAAPVFIDQEGGRVQRLRPPLAETYPPGAAIGALYRRDREAGLRAAWLMSRLHADDLSPATASMPTACRFSTCRWRARMT